MKLPSLLSYSAVLIAIWQLAAPALAAYSQPASTFSAGGEESVSAAYTNLGVIGQAGIVGSSTSAGYTVDHGFLPVLGGWKILYPVISATPGTLTFSLASGIDGNQPLGIGNEGGSTLIWSVAKNAADSIFSLSQASGTNSGSVTVTASAAGLAVGTYHNTLTISGAGINDMVFVQLDLTVTAAPVLYTLAVTLKQGTPGKGGGNITMAIPPAAAVKACSHLDATCSSDFPADSIVTLSQYPDSNSQWGTWEAPGCARNPNCQIVLNAPQVTDITFPYAFMAKLFSLGSSPANGFDSLGVAYAGASTTDTIQVRAVTFPAGDLIMGSPKTITLLGGLDAYYAPQNGQYSTLNGKLVIRDGKLIVDKLEIK